MTSAAATPVRMASSMATRELLAEIARRFNARSGLVLSAQAGGGVEIAKRVRAGERFDLVVLAADAIEALDAEGLMYSETRLAVVDSAMGVAMRAADARPEIATVEELRRALRAAGSIGYSTGPSGNHLLKMLAMLGLAQELAPRLKQAPAGVPVAQFIASGQVELGFQQISELINQPEVSLLGALPPEVQLVTRFTAAACRSTARLDDVNEVLAYLNDPEHDELKRAMGMAPPGTGARPAT